jgi:hypothetical protein
VRPLISRTAACVASVSLALGAAALPCTAGETGSPHAGAPLTRLSPASRALLVASPRGNTVAAPRPRSGDGRSSVGGRTSVADQPAATPASPGSFFSSTRGKVTLALMGAGVGLTLWSIHHDRQPVKSPIR